MKETTLTLHTKYQVGRVDPRMFGGFLEHMGRAVYQGVYDPESIHVDPSGFRSDVLDALKKLEMSVMRYPGGNFASGYHWMDGIGPGEQRPTVRELAWHSLEPNHFGTDEFIQLCNEMGWAPMVAVNLGTGTPEEASNWVEYCNSPIGTKYADMRARNGHKDPYGVKLWCLGNEMDGSWQLGHVPADQYALRARQAARIMKGIDPQIELVACGSSGPFMPTYIEWDRQVLEYLGEDSDYISLHRYVGNPDNDTADYLAIANSIDQQIEEIDAVCRFVQAKLRSKKRAYLSFDEWNIWYRDTKGDGEGKFAPHLIEEVYNLEDALVTAGFLNSFIRHANVVKIANLAQIVNVIAPIQTRGHEILLQSIYYPFKMYSQRKEGVSLKVIVDGPTYEGKVNGAAHFIDTSAILNKDKLGVFVVNRSLAKNAGVRINLHDREIIALKNADLLTGPDAKASNSFEQPDLIVSRPYTDIRITEGKAYLELPPLSLVAMTFLLQ